MLVACLLVAFLAVANAQAPSCRFSAAVDKRSNEVPSTSVSPLRSPTDAPRQVACPTNGSLITRVGSPLDGTQKLSADEATFISERREQVGPLWTNYLANDTGYNVSQIIANEPKL